MKTRSDFVTNSSSSSFVLAMKAMPDIDKDTLKKYPFLKAYMQLVEKVFDSGELIKTKEELDQWFMHEYGYPNTTLEALLGDDEYLQPDYMEMADKIDTGYWLWCADVDYDEETMREIIYSLKDGNNFILIKSD